MNKKTTVYILVLIITIFLQSCYKEKVVYETDPDDVLQLPVFLKLDGRECFFDAQFNMLRYAFSRDSSGFSPEVEFANESQVYFEGRRLKNNQINDFGTVEVGKPYGLTIEKDGDRKEFDMIFTNNPIIQIICDSEIYDEPKTLARVKVSDPSSEIDFSSFCGIEHRGKFTKYENKRSMGFELRQNMNSTSEYSAGIFNFKPNTDWILTSAVIDPSRIRNLVSFDIWNGLESWNGGEVADHIGVHSKLTELFLNNKFRGIYVFSERINSIFLNAGNDAVLYKAEEWSEGATRFERFEPNLSINRFWNGWEQEVPDPDVEINWKPLKKLYELVVDSDDSEFRSSISDLIDVENFADYFLLLNLTSAVDNTGKNLFLYKKDKAELFQIIPWDLDGSWGIIYDGSKIEPDALLSNRLFDRLIATNAGNFRTTVKERWFYLRQNSFAEATLHQRFNYRFSQLTQTDVIEKENRIWNENLDMEQEKVYIKNWTKKRLDFLDRYFEQL